MVSRIPTHHGLSNGFFAGSPIQEAVYTGNGQLEDVFSEASVPVIRELQDLKKTNPQELKKLVWAKRLDGQDGLFPVSVFLDSCRHEDLVFAVEQDANQHGDPFDVQKKKTKSPSSWQALFEGGLVLLGVGVIQIARWTAPFVFHPKDSSTNHRINRQSP